MKYYNTLEPIGEFFKVVIPEMKEPKSYHYAHRLDYWGSLETWENHLASLPQAALTKINKVGWIDEKDLVASDINTDHPGCDAPV